MIDSKKTLVDCGSSYPTTLDNIMNALIKLYPGKTITYNSLASRVGDVFASKSKRDFDAFTTLEYGLKQTIKWYQKK